MSVISGSAINKLFLKVYDGSAFVVHDHVAAAAVVSTDVIVAVAVSSIVIVHEFIPEKGVPSFECR